MSESTSQQARALATAFDRSFEQPARADEDEGRPALSLRVGGDPYLLPLEGLSSVARAPKIVPLPSSPPAQLGVAGIHGALIGVFSLSALLGYDARHARAVAWLVVIGGRQPIGLGVEQLEGQVLVPTRCVLGDVATPGSRPHVVGLALLEGESGHRGILDIDSVLRGIAADIG